MNRSELRAVLALSAVLALRLLGLFMILPVFAALASDLAGADSFTIGLALGVYGLTQGLLQLPMGWLSDRLGRRPVIAAGLLLFIAGSALAAMSTHIWAVILGRALQGCGAIAGAAMAWAADASRESQRSKAMALIGSGIGAAFVLAMVAGPVAASFLALGGIFWLAAALGVLAFGLIWLLEATPAASHASAPGWPRPSAQVAALCGQVFLLHGLLTALFLVVPTKLVAGADLALEEHWLVYLPALLIAALVSLPLVFRGRERHARHRLAPGVLAMTAGVALLAWGPPGALAAVVGLALFFTGFTLLEATLPALMSVRVAAGRRGAAMGLYATCQFFGAFAGGVGAGLVLGTFGASAVFVLAVGLGLVWAAVAFLPTRKRVHLPTDP